MLNNFRLDHTLHYSQDLATMYLDDLLNNDEVLTLRGRDGIDYLVIGCLDEPHYDVNELYSYDVDELTELFYLHELDYDASIYSKSELIDELVRVDNEAYYSKVYEDNDWRDIADYDFIVNGCSQGDSCKVLILDKGEYSYIDERYVSDLLYRQPISGNLELYYNLTLLHDIPVDDLIDVYDYYDKGEVIESIKANYTGLHKVSLFSLLDSTLPDQIDYE